MKDSSKETCKELQFNFSTGGNSTKKSMIPLYFSLVVVVLFLSLYFLMPEVQISVNYALEILTSNDNERIKNWVTNFSWFGPILLILAMVAQMFLLVIPTTVLLVVCILAYGPLWGSVIAFFAIYLASSVGYVIGKYFGSMTIERIVGSRSRNKSAEFLQKYGFWAIFITRLNPFFSNDVVSLVSGMLRMGYWNFVFATLTGIAPLIVFIAVLGENTQSLFYGLFAGSVAILLIISAYVFFKKRKSNKSKFIT